MRARAGWGRERRAARRCSRPNSGAAPPTERRRCARHDPISRMSAFQSTGEGSIKPGSVQPAEPQLPRLAHAPAARAPRAQRARMEETRRHGDRRLFLRRGQRRLHGARLLGAPHSELKPLVRAPAPHGALRALHRAGVIFAGHPRCRLHARIHLDRGAAQLCVWLRRCPAGRLARPPSSEGCRLCAAHTSGTAPAQAGYALGHERACYAGRRVRAERRRAPLNRRRRSCSSRWLRTCPACCPSRRPGRDCSGTAGRRGRTRSRGRAPPSYSPTWCRIRRRPSSRPVPGPE